jgi:uncharacterized protein (TIGR03067 family)
MNRAIFASALALLVATVAPAEDKAMQRELESLKGTWHATRALGPQGESPKEALDGMAWTFKEGGKAVFSLKVFQGKDWEYTYRVDPSKTPKIIDFTYVGPYDQFKGLKQLGIYKLEKGKLTLCLAEAHKDRPKVFAVKGEDRTLLELERRTTK